MKTTVYIATSFYDFIARENGDLDWLPGSHEGESHDSDIVYESLRFQDFIDSVDVVVMGRNVYEMVISTGQWPCGSKRVAFLMENG